MQNITVCTPHVRLLWSVSGGVFALTVAHTPCGLHALLWLALCVVCTPYWVRALTKYCSHSMWFALCTEYMHLLCTDCSACMDYVLHSVWSACTYCGLHSHTKSIPVTSSLHMSSVGWVFIVVGWLWAGVSHLWPWPPDDPTTTQPQAYKDSPYTTHMASVQLYWVRRSHRECVGPY